jgi:hypothetical protein
VISIISGPELGLPWWLGFNRNTKKKGEFPANYATPTELSWDVEPEVSARSVCAAGCACLCAVMDPDISQYLFSPEKNENAHSSLPLLSFLQEADPAEAKTMGGDGGTDAISFSKAKRKHHYDEDGKEVSACDGVHMCASSPADCAIA